ncbi:hypothetical protein K490DRAFT_68673 [Saccharata proteae CBS 121410]|uniref:Uncharacterized protein n=1 Tax=Saccharata proteae CBS 121410 TaxID=1314787 RepID=A0A9P4LUV7_9PEZI|nr:hypothetical protein K490DRAFT_68673 [Saccharata proteae CBS 121410]
MKWFLLAGFEAWATMALLRSPSFHRVVHNIHRNVRRIRHGTPPEELGGTNIDRPSFLKHFADEIKDQLRGGPPKSNDRLKIGPKSK